MSEITPCKVRKHWDRAQIISYLETWGVACYDEESTEDLAECAAETLNAEGDGYLLCDDYNALTTDEANEIAKNR